MVSRSHEEIDFATRVATFYSVANRPHCETKWSGWVGDIRGE